MMVNMKHELVEATHYLTLNDLQCKIYSNDADNPVSVCGVKSVKSDKIELDTQPPKIISRDYVKTPSFYFKNGELIIRSLDDQIYKFSRKGII